MIAFGTPCAYHKRQPGAWRETVSTPITIIDLFRRHSQPSPDQERLTKEASQLLNNSNDGQYVVRRVSLLATVNPALQDDYLRRIIEDLKPSERLKNFIEQAGECLRTPPAHYVGDAKTVLPLLSEWLSALNPASPAFKAACEDLTRIHDEFSQSIGGCFLYNAALKPDERKTYTDNMERVVPRRLASLRDMVRVAAATTCLPQAERRRFNEHAVVEARTLADQSVARNNVLNQAGPQRQQTERQAVETFINRSISLRCENIISKPADQDTTADTLAVAFWQEVLCNLPLERTLTREHVRLNQFLSGLARALPDRPTSDVRPA